MPDKLLFDINQLMQTLTAWQTSLLTELKASKEMQSQITDLQNSMLNKFNETSARQREMQSQITDLQNSMVNNFNVIYARLRVNVALNRPAMQQSTWENSSASNAVDGSNETFLVHC
jgi:predicted  nucleic acid-binding Zn-ribbon protein